MKVSKAQVFAAATLARAAYAGAPNVTSIPVGPSCTAYPGFDGTNAGPFLAVADSTGQAVDGIAMNAQYFVDGTRHYGYITGPVTPPRLGPSRNISLRCFQSTLQAQVAPQPDAEATWQDLVVSGDPTLEGALGFGFPEDRYANIPVGPYWHFVDGQQLPGIYLGAAGSATFGFVDNRAGNAGEYYLLRLLGTNKFTKWELGERDTVGFVKMTYLD
ncbi:hypothetical protein F4802DRAFT_597660 [Xylaria palmicola]|nr:hypothetical protein F4802DRAFT_597660 [Xylaria palmicola]